MNYSNVLSVQWANAEHTAINCMVNFDDLREELVPFTAVAQGDYPHSHEIFARCVAGDCGDAQEYEHQRHGANSRVHAGHESRGAGPHVRPDAGVVDAAGGRADLRGGRCVCGGRAAARRRRGRGCRVAGRRRAS